MNNLNISKIGSRLINIPSLNFLGPYSESDNKKYIISWSGSDYLLAKNNTVIHTGKVEVSGIGCVANTGTFIIADFTFEDKLQGIFYAFDSSGIIIIKQYLSANIYNCAISNDGKYAVCQCANSETEEGGMLVFFDINAGKLLWRNKPICGWADSYSFDQKNKWLLLEKRDQGKYRYTYDGKFIDKPKWGNDRVKFASPYELLRIVEEQHKNMKGSLSADDAKKIQSLLNRALKGLNDDSWRKSKIYRIAGEVCEELGKKANAIKYYEMALQLNQKVGVKRRLSNLKNINLN